MKAKSIIALVLASTFATGAMAEDARRIDFTVPVLDLNGKALHESDEKSPVVTLGLAASAALLRQTPQQTDPIKVAKRALLAQRIATAKDIALTAEETAQIKDSIGFFPPIYVLRVIEAVDPAALK